VTTVLLLRHAQSEWNAAGRWQGWADPPLTALGRAQAEQAGERLRRSEPPLDRAVSSDLDRARTTARIIAGLAGTPALLARAPMVEEVPGLRELNVGQWSGLTRGEIQEAWPDTLAAWDAGALESTPGGEDRAEFNRRVRAAFVEVAESHPGERLLVVAHGGVVRSIGRWLGAPPENALHIAGFWVDHTAGRSTLTAPVDLLVDEGSGAHPAGDGPPDEGPDEEPADKPGDRRVPDDSADAR
jgi:probable phosphoglycerate mutase